MECHVLKLELWRQVLQARVLTQCPQKTKVKEVITTKCGVKYKSTTRDILKRSPVEVLLSPYRIWLRGLDETRFFACGMVVDGRKPVLVVCFERANWTDEIPLLPLAVIVLWHRTGNRIGAKAKHHVSPSKIPFNIRDLRKQTLPDSMECGVLKLEFWQVW